MGIISKVNTGTIEPVLTGAMVFDAIHGEKMFLVRLIYFSSPTDGPASQTIKDILQAARVNNDRHELTGLMLLDHQYFLQVVEGGRGAVSQLLGNLYKDPRHQDLIVLGFDRIDRRAFGEWSMQFVPATSVTQQVLLRHGASRLFEPRHMTKESALDLLSELRGMASA